MVLEPNERDAWVADAQRWITQIKGVKQCRINLDDQGEVEEILVVAGVEKAPRMIVRDVETLLKARLDIDIYYKKISVTQLIDNSHDFDAEGQDLAALARAMTGGDAVDSGDEPASVTHHDTRPLFEEADDLLAVPGEPAGVETQARAETMSDPGSGPETDPISRPNSERVTESEGEAPARFRGEAASAVDPLTTAIPAVVLAEEPTLRIVCDNVGVTSSDMTVRAEVLLRAGEVEVVGKAEGPNHADSDMELIARATLAALSSLLIDPVLLHIREVRLERVGRQEIILSAVDLVEGRNSDTLFGSCSTRHNRQQAVVFSVLDALNRRLNLYALKSSAVEG